MNVTNKNNPEGKSSMQNVSNISKNGNAAQANSIEQQMEIGLQSLESAIYEAVNKSDVEILREASHHILEAGGKRMRPRMVISAYLACGGTDLDYVAPIAAAVELVHTASVVHDDINDHGVVRRGKPSINAIWGRTFALLTGDFMFTKVYELMAPYKEFNVVLAEAAVALVEGETLQASAVKNNTLNRTVYNQIIAKKTAALFQSGAKLGALAAGADAETVEALGNYGFNVGMAFQVIDDILDLTADSEQLGKTAGIDLEQGRGIGAAVASEEADDPMEAIKQKLLAGEAIEEGKAQAALFVEMAISNLEDLPASEGKDYLEELAQLTIDRDF